MGNYDRREKIVVMILIRNRYEVNNYVYITVSLSDSLILSDFLFLHLKLKL